VSRNDAPEPYSISGSEQLEIKIGDADVTISGAHTYTIQYTLRGALSYFDDGTSELYWNATGHNWPVAIKEAEITVTSDRPILESSCYSGGVGDTASCIRDGDADSRVNFSVRGLDSGEGVTFGVGFGVSAMPVVVHESVQFWILICLGLGVGLLYTIIQGRRYKYAFYKNDPIIAQYEPFAAIEPMYAGALIDDRLDARDISAGLIYLAEQRYITIKKNETTTLHFFTTTDYHIMLIRPPSDLTDTFLVEILKIIFGSDPVVGQTVALSAIKRDESQKRVNAERITALRAALKKDLLDRGFFEERAVSKATIIAAIGACLSILFGIPVVTTIPDMLPVVVLVGGVCALVIVAALYKNRRRTALGYDAQHHLHGFKDFLSITDKERFDYHNAPERNPEQFMKYLPYAIAFSVEEKWAALFADMEISNPSWYEDSDATGSMAALSLATQMSQLSQNIVATSATPRSNSSGRGSSGGGFSGGGGGGGGGGSW
jgi:uncharacterized membrane protein YgcG